VNTQVENPESVPIRPAATVIPLRDGSNGLEVLVLRRDTNLAFHGGSWVFPGGRVDSHETEAANGDDLIAAQTAAVREANEEAGLDLLGSKLVPLSHWTTPLGRNRRFATWFFVANAPDGDIVIDDGEIREFEWHLIHEAISGCDDGSVMLAGPTYVSLLGLQIFSTVDQALTTIESRPNKVFLPRLVHSETATVSLYQNDPGYSTGDLSARGPRHRMHMNDIGYQYINEHND